MSASWSVVAPAARSRAFTLAELLVVIAIVLALIAILLPSFHAIRRSTLVVKDLANLRMLQSAQLSYATDHNGYLADARLPHGGVAQGIEFSFVTTLQPYYDSSFAVRSPLDHSDHWPAASGGAGVPVPGSADRMRVTSYGINNYLARQYSPQAAVDPSLMTDRLSKVPSPSATIHMLLMTETGAYAGSDHPHVEGWGSIGAAPLVASTQVATAAAGGLPKTGDARSNWSFLDGRVATLRFNNVFINDTVNHFDPAVSGLCAARIGAASGS